MICLLAKPSQSFLSTVYWAKKNFLIVKELFKEKEKWMIEQKMKSRFFNCSLLLWSHNINKKTY